MKNPSLLKAVPFFVLLGLLLFSSNCFFSCTRSSEIFKRDTTQTNPPATDSTATTDTTHTHPVDSTKTPPKDTTQTPPKDTTKTPPKDTSHTPPTVTLTQPDHIIFVWLENKGYPQIVGSSSAPWINDLIKKGTLFTNSHGLTHPSYPNYVAFFSGGYQGVKNDDCIDGTPFKSDNLFTAMKAVNKSFAWYSEGLPAVGSTTCKSGNYAEKHNPVTVFSNVSTSANKPFSDFPSDYSKLENVVCITPNLQDDMHDGSIGQGDSRMKKNLTGLIEWCRTHNSIFVVYFDEDDKANGNRIPVVAVGEHVKANYKLDTKYDHYNWTKTICSMFKASSSWSDNVKAKDDITGCWQ